MEKLNGTLKQSGNLTGEEIPVIIKEKTVIEKDYENLDNKPSINDVILEGNKTPEELGLTKASDFELYKQSVSHSFRSVSESIQSVKTESKTYTDNAIEATKAYSDGKNSDLETAINKTINNKDNATRAYASHLVSEERGARETADEETLTASKSYTDTAVVKEVTKGPASSLEFEGLQEGIPFPKIILTVPDEYVYEEGKTVHSINICCNNNADPDATELYSENMLVVAKSNTVEIGYDDDIKLLKQVPGKCIVGFSNEEDAAVCTLTVTGALKYEALKRIYSECWNRMDVEKDNMEGYVRGYTDTEITKCKEYTDEKIAEVSGGSDITSSGNPVQIDGLQGGVPFSEMVVSGKNLLLGIVDLYPTANGNLATNSNAVSAYAKCNPNTTYTIQRNGGSRLQCMATQALPSNGTTFSKATTSADQTANTIKYTMPDNCNYIVVYLTGTAEEITDIQIEEGSIATEYETPITGQNITLWACKKNLMCYPYWAEIQGGTLEHNGVTYTLNADMSISANGTATADSYCILHHITMSPNVNRLIKNTDYFLSGSPVGSGVGTYQIYAGIYDNDGNRVEIYHDYGSGVSIRIANDYRCAASILIKKGQTVSNLIFRPQLEFGSAATDYEMPSGTSHIITPDSNPYVIPNDIRQQDGLNNITVSAGTLSVTGVRKNAALKRVWKEMNDFNAKIGNINTILESVTGGVE